MKPNFILAIGTAILLAASASGEDYTTNIISGTVVDAPGSYAVGENGSHNYLQIDSGGSLTNDSAYIGSNSTAFANSALVIGAGSAWEVTGDNADYALLVGYFGSSNQLTIADGGVVDVYIESVVGYDVGATSNTVTVTGAGAQFNAVDSGLYVGSDGSGNSLTITNGAGAEIGTLVVGADVTAGNNRVMVTDPNSQLSVDDELYVGYDGSGNSLIITNGALVGVPGLVLGADSSASNNYVLVAGSNSELDVYGELDLGLDGSGNQLIVTNGAALSAGSLYIGFNNVGASNSLFVAGPGSAVNTYDFEVGLGGSGNQAVFIDGVTVTNNGSFVVGDNVGANGNSALIDGTNSSWYVGGLVGIGRQGSFNQLIVTNGAVLTANNFPSYIGLDHATNNSVIVTGAGSVWDVAGNLGVGNGDFGNSADGNFSNQLAILGGGVVSNTGTAYIGLTHGANNNSVTVSGTGSVWSVGDRIVVGWFGSSNQLIIADGGVVNSSGFDPDVGSMSTAYGNSVTVTGTGSLWNVDSPLLYVGFNGSSNQLIVSNGGVVNAQFSYIGNGGADNSVTVSGPGSAWNLSDGLSISGQGLTVTNGGVVGCSYVQSSGDMTVSDAGSTWTILGQLQFSGFLDYVYDVDLGEYVPVDRVIRLAITGGGSVVASNVTVGFATVAATDSVLEVDCGSLIVTNATHDGTVDLESGILNLGSCGILVVDQLFNTNAPNGGVNLNGGTIRVNNNAQFDQGALAVSSGAMEVFADVVVGSAADTTGAVVMTGGTLIATNANSAIRVGNLGALTNGSGVGSWTMSHANVRAANILLGSSAGGRGEWTLDSGGSVAGVGNNCMLVVNGFGQIGGDLSWTNIGSAMYCGYAHPGAYTLSNGTSSCQDVYVGYDNAGTMSIAGGAMTILSRLLVGQLASPLSTGAVWITGGSLTMTNNYCIIGNSGFGQVAMSNGTVTALALIVGNGGNPGTLTIAGGTMTVLSNLTVGNCGAGLVGSATINGGSLYVTNAAHTSVLDVQDGAVTMSSGLLQVDKLIVTNSCGRLLHTGGTLLYSQLVLDPNLSAVGDGIPNGWKQKYGLDPFDPNLANEDPDGDGFNNLQEYLAGTDPNNPASTPLRITAIARESANIRVTWNTYPGTTNALQATTGGANGNYATNGFANIFSVTNVAVSVTNYLDLGATTNFPARYYRVRLVP